MDERDGALPIRDHPPYCSRLVRRKASQVVRLPMNLDSFFLFPKDASQEQQTPLDHTRDGNGDRDRSHRLNRC